jgi:hypothetical protein
VKVTITFGYGKIEPQGINLVMSKNKDEGTDIIASCLDTPETRAKIVSAIAKVMTDAYERENKL